MGSSRRLPVDMFRFTSGDRADLYTAVLRAFGEANDRLETALGLQEIRARLRHVGWFDALDDGDLVDCLRSLTQWQLLDAVQD